MDQLIKILATLTVVIVFCLVAYRFIWPYGGEPPALVKGFSSNDALLIDQEFDQRVRKSFPPGTEEKHLAFTLSQLGFTLSTGTFPHTAVYGQRHFTCQNVWTIRWQPDDLERVAEISGHYQKLCL